VRVHDAFVVRYRAGRQALLPLHADESALSLTLPLNPHSDFAGGGTYFGALRRAVSPAVGHGVLFEGRALHGGEPIAGAGATRYVLAAFFYLDTTAGATAGEGSGQGGARARADREPWDEEEEGTLFKRQKFLEANRQSDTGSARASFSFGFF